MPVKDWIAASQTVRWSVSHRSGLYLIVRKYRNGSRRLELGPGLDSFGYKHLLQAMVAGIYLRGND